MWTDIFKEQIRKEKIKQKDLYPIMGISKETFILNIRKHSMNIEHVLRAYEHFHWDLNKLIENNDNFISEPTEEYKITPKSENNYTFELKEIKNLYEKRIEDLKEENKYLREQLNKFIKGNNSLEEGVSNTA